MPTTAPDWTARDWLRYGLARLVRLVSGTRIAATTVLLGLDGLGAYETSAHLDFLHHEADAAIPRAVQNQVVDGHHVERTVSNSAVRFFVVVHHHEHLLVTYPRGLGLAHISLAATIGDYAVRFVWPWLFVVLGAIFLAAIAIDIAKKRLRPPPSSVTVRAIDRSEMDLRCRPLRPSKARAFKVLSVDPYCAGWPLVDFTRHRGGENYGAEASANVMRLNRFRRQRPRGAITSETTRLRPGWELLAGT